MKCNFDSSEISLTTLEDSDLYLLTYHPSTTLTLTEAIEVTLPIKFIVPRGMALKLIPNFSGTVSPDLIGEHDFKAPATRISPLYGLPKTVFSKGIQFKILMLNVGRAAYFKLSDEDFDADIALLSLN